MYCQVCGASAPTKNVAFSQNVGALFVRSSRTVSGNLCRACIGRSFWRMTLVTLLFGWWHLFLFFTTLFILPSNVVNYVGALSLPRAGAPPPKELAAGARPGKTPA